MPKRHLMTIGHRQLFREFLMSILEQLKAALLASGKSQREIEDAVGIPQASISRFINGKRGLRIEDADALASYLGMELRPAEAKKPPAKKSPKK